MHLPGQPDGGNVDAPIRPLRFGYRAPSRRRGIAPPHIGALFGPAGAWNRNLLLYFGVRQQAAGGADHNRLHCGCPHVYA